MSSTKSTSTERAVHFDGCTGGEHGHGDGASGRFGSGEMCTAAYGLTQVVFGQSRGAVPDQRPSSITWMLRSLAQMVTVRRARAAVNFICWLPGNTNRARGVRSASHSTA